jgi:hypothetical protein
MTLAAIILFAYALGAWIHRDVDHQKGPRP